MNPSIQVPANSTIPMSPTTRSHDVGTVLATVNGNARGALTPKKVATTKSANPTLVAKNGKATNASHVNVMVTISPGIFNIELSTDPRFILNQRVRTSMPNAAKRKKTELTIAVNSCDCDSRKRGQNSEKTPSNSRLCQGVKLRAKERPKQAVGEP